MGSSQASTQPHAPVIALHQSLDVALHDAFQSRSECRNMQLETIDACSAVPNHSSGLPARKLLLRLSRSAERLGAATERLEAEARTLYYARIAESTAAAQRFQQMQARLEAQRDTRVRARQSTTARRASCTSRAF